MKNESETQCALRELFEETGLSSQEVELDPDFRFTETYYPMYKRYGGEQVEKTVVIFLGYLKTDADIRTAEHTGYEWIEWNPPHKIQAKTIDPLLAEAEKHFGSENR